MRKQILFTCFALFAVSGFAAALIQEPEPDKSFIGILNFFIPAIIASVGTLFSDASKWWSTGMWDWKVFFDTKLKPFLLSLGVAIAVYAAILYVPFLRPMLEGMAQYNLTEVTAFTMIGLASALIDNVLKKEPTPEEQRAFVRRYNMDSDRSL